jgi:hypothetical protein
MMETNMTRQFDTKVGGEKPQDTEFTPFIEVPAAVVAAFGNAKRPRVLVTVNGHTFRTTVAVYGGRFYLPFNKANRAAAQAQLGDDIHVALELVS